MQIRLHAEPVNPAEPNNFVEVLDSMTNLGPIIDFVVVDLERQGQGQASAPAGLWHIRFRDAGGDGNVLILDLTSESVLKSYKHSMSICTPSGSQHNDKSCSGVYNAYRW